jgi:GTP cyclohydrolase II
MSASPLTRSASARIPTEYGEFQLCCFTTAGDDKTHLAFYMGEIQDADDVLVRVHSECFTGDVLGSQRCDCGEQLDLSLQMIAAEGTGMVVYLRQEGRGIGLLQKMKAYNLQDAGHDTVDANLMLGHQADERDYTLAARILEGFGIRSIRLLTNNPIKISSLESEGIHVNERVEMESSITPENARYLMTKVRRMNHLLKLTTLSTALSGTDPHEPQPTD